MNCDQYDCDINDDNCQECNDAYGCDDYSAFKSQAAMEKLKDTEFGKAMCETLGKIVGISDSRIEESMQRFVKEVFRATQAQLTECAMKAAQAAASKHIETKASELLDKAFAEAIKEHTLFLKKDDLTVTQSIQKIVMDRVKNFFATSESRGRKAINDSLEHVIRESVNAKVETALEEIKAESIEKFNKQAMKMMMQGMAKAIGQDKKLLAVLCNED